MSSGMYGADVAQLRELARGLQSASDQLDGARQRVGGGIRIAAWMGPVAVRFRLMWDSEYSRLVQTAADDLERIAREVLADAEEQERASARDGGTAALGSSRLPAATDVGIDTDGDGSIDTVEFSEGGSRITHEWQDGVLENATFVESAYAGGRHSGDADSGWTEDGGYAAEAHVSGSYGIEAVNERHSEWGDLDLDSRAELFTGVRGEARAGAEIGLDGASAGAAVGAFAGWEGGGSGSVGTDVAGVDLGVTARAGFGADAKVDASASYDEVKFEMKIGLALGIGASIKPAIRFSPRKIAEALPKFW
ncbi:hypothetical protein MT349_10935 [Rathayibacter caricis]|uniref:hypothetical protein n=1 Tax=Rathayibacter caricis TaxID=110936 RepID=UPI001FB43579|nr:hypothetical protein [Rathayibacter caricis]MCJ1696298.1 hypothetical protein [Rathayibacter caricis]